METCCPSYRDPREQTYSRGSDLLDEPLDSPEVECFTDGSFVEIGTQQAAYATASLDEVIKAKALPLHILAQMTELTELMRALQLGKNTKLNIFTDSKCGFHLPYARATICKERGRLTARNSPIKQKIWFWLF